MNKLQVLPEIFIGTGGWEFGPSDHLFYPSKTNKDFRKLEYYSRFFDSVEIKATFYNPSFAPWHVQRWLNDVSANTNFQFTVKLYQGFTHDDTATQDDVRTVCRMLDALADAGKLGGVLIQFPYLFTNIKERRAYLMQLSRVFGRYPVFVEVRHNSWYAPMMYNFFQENRMHLVNVDRPLTKNHIPFLCLGWDGAAYFRLTGRSPLRHHTTQESGENSIQTYFYSEKEIEHVFYLVQRVKSQVKKIFFFFQNEPKSHAVANAFQLQYLAKQKQPVLVPDNLLERYPLLKQISTDSKKEYSLFTEKAA